MRDRFIQTLFEIAKKDSNVHLVTGDLGFMVLNPFWENLPDQITNLGIAEQNMIGFATGMALSGKIVYVYSIGNFPTLRALEQIRNDSAYHNANVKIISVGAGLSYGSLGMSHHATEDISILRALPNITVFSPANDFEVEQVTKSSYSIEGTCYIRVGRSSEYNPNNRLIRFAVGEPVNVFKGEKIALISTGEILSEVIKARETLLLHGYNPSIYSFPTIKPLDSKQVINCLLNYELVFTIEEHNIMGGFGSAIAEIFITINNKSKLYLIGIRDKYISDVGNQKYLRQINGIDSTGIFRFVISILENDFNQ